MAFMEITAKTNWQRLDCTPEDDIGICVATPPSGTSYLSWRTYTPGKDVPYPRLTISTRVRDGSSIGGMSIVASDKPAEDVFWELSWFGVPTMLLGDMIEMLWEAQRALNPRPVTLSIAHEIEKDLSLSGGVTYNHGAWRNTDGVALQGYAQGYGAKITMRKDRVIICRFSDQSILAYDDNEWGAVPDRIAMYDPSALTPWLMRRGMGDKDAHIRTKKED